MEVYFGFSGKIFFFKIYFCLFIVNPSSLQLLIHHLLLAKMFLNNQNKCTYYIPITDTTVELSVFCASDTESRINELRFSESISLSFKTRLTSVTCFCGDVT